MINPPDPNVWDPIDPHTRFNDMAKRKFRNTLVTFVAIVFVLVVFGVPSITFQANARIGADYWNPILGWRHVMSGEYGQRGCPLILFIPLTDCLRESISNETESESESEAISEDEFQTSPKDTSSRGRGGRHTRGQRGN